MQWLDLVVKLTQFKLPGRGISVRVRLICAQALKEFLSWKTQLGVGGIIP